MKPAYSRDHTMPTVNVVPFIIESAAVALIKRDIPSLAALQSVASETISSPHDTAAMRFMFSALLESCELLMDIPSAIELEE